MANSTGPASANLSITARNAAATARWSVTSPVSARNSTWSIGEQLWGGQVGPRGRVDVVEHVRQGRIRQNGFSGRGARGEDPEPASRRLLDGG